MAAHPELSARSDANVGVQPRGGEAGHGEFQRLYEGHARLLLSFLAARRPRSETAEDLAQEVWLRVSRALETRFDGEDFRAWLYKIAWNVLRDAGRRQKRRGDSSAAEASDAPDPRPHNPIEDLLRTERTRALRDCLERLDDGFRSVVAARLADHSFEEISGRFGIPVNTAMTRFHRAKEQLHDCLQRTLP
jgi:RNA polymerase sigma-70 factor (ECF subfamily)